MNLVGIVSLKTSILVGVLAFGAGSISGIYFGYQYHSGQVAQDAAKELKDAKDEQDRIAGIARDLGQALAKEAARRADERVAWRKRLKDAEKAGTLVNVVCPGNPGLRLDPASPDRRPDVLLSGDFVRLFDDAMLGHPPGNRRADDGSAGHASPAESVEPVAVLENADENGERWAKCRASLTLWQQLAIRSGWAK